MDVETHRRELRTRLLQARTVRERRLVLADLSRFLRTLSPSYTKTLTLQLLAYGYMHPFGDWRRAMTYAAKTMAQPFIPECVKTYIPLLWGIALVHVGRYDQALPLLEQGELSPDNTAQARAWRIGALLHLGRVSEARTLLNSFPALDSEWAWANYYDATAHVLEAEGAFRGAQEAAGQAIRRYTKLGEFTEAHTLFLLTQLLARCADHLGDNQARRVAIQSAAAHSLNIRHAEQARRMLTPGERGGEYTNAAAESLCRLGACHRRLGDDGSGGGCLWWGSPPVLTRSQ